MNQPREPRVLVGLVLWGATGLGNAAGISPVGYWETIDDDGKTLTAMVHIYCDDQDYRKKSSRS